MSRTSLLNGAGLALALIAALAGGLDRSRRAAGLSPALRERWRYPRQQEVAALLEAFRLASSVGDWQASVFLYPCRAAHR